MSTARVTRAADRVAEATRAARLARIAAAPELRAAAIRRSRWFRAAVWAMAAFAVLLVIAALVIGLDLRSSQDRAETDDAIVSAARSAAVTMLSADPGDPTGYVDRVQALSTGAQLDRVRAARDAIVGEVAGQPGRSVGQVISAGLAESAAADVESAVVLVVADATNPMLLGGGAAGVDPEGERITVRFRMQRVDGTWKVAEARPL